MISREKFVYDLTGAVCRNRYWSWSFVNHDTRHVVFGAWEDTDGGTGQEKQKILDKSWERNEKGRRNPGYNDSLNNIQLVFEQDYILSTFVMKHMPADPRHPEGKSRIADFDKEIKRRYLIRDESSWWAVTPEFTAAHPEILNIEESFSYVEGGKRLTTIVSYERNKEARRKCLEHHGVECQICEFNFETIYGGLGAGYIHVHHLRMLSERKEEHNVNPKTDLIPVCANCHAMIHMNGKLRTPTEMRTIMKEVRSLPS